MGWIRTSGYQPPLKGKKQRPLRWKFFYFYFFEILLFLLSQLENLITYPIPSCLIFHRESFSARVLSPHTPHFWFVSGQIVY